MSQNPALVHQSNNDLWQNLEIDCAAAICLAQDIATHLERGAQANEFVPLMRQELELTNQLRANIDQLGRHPAQVDAQRRDRLAQQMSSLLELENQNHQLLTRKGVRLKGPAFSRHSGRP